MEAINDTLRVHDFEQMNRHRRVAQILCERCPNTGKRLGTRNVLGGAQRLMDMHDLGARHPMIAAKIGGAR